MTRRNFFRAVAATPLVACGGCPDGPDGPVVLKARKIATTIKVPNELIQFSCPTVELFIPLSEAEVQELKEHGLE